MEHESNQRVDADSKLVRARKGLGCKSSVFRCLKNAACLCRDRLRQLASFITYRSTRLMRRGLVGFGVSTGQAMPVLFCPAEALCYAPVLTRAYCIGLLRK